LQALQVLQVRSHLEPVVLEPVLLLQLLPLREMPSRHQDLHQVLLLILLRVRDQLLHSFWQRSFSLLPSWLVSSLQLVLHLGIAQ
jgi:hypothetical protein